MPIWNKSVIAFLMLFGSALAVTVVLGYQELRAFDRTISTPVIISLLLLLSTILVKGKKNKVIFGIATLLAFLVMVVVVLLAAMFNMSASGQLS